MDELISFSVPRRIAAGYNTNLSMVLGSGDGNSAQVRCWGSNEHNAIAQQSLLSQGKLGDKGGAASQDDDNKGISLAAARKKDPTQNNVRNNFKQICKNQRNTCRN